MILGFAGWQNAIVQPGMHHFIGAADTVEEVREGLKEWMSAEREGWRQGLLKHHPVEYANALSCKLEFWMQIVDQKDEACTIVEETQARCHRCFTLPVGALK